MNIIEISWKAQRSKNAFHQFSAFKKVRKRSKLIHFHSFCHLLICLQRETTRRNTKKTHVEIVANFKITCVVLNVFAFCCLFFYFASFFVNYLFYIYCLSGFARYFLPFGTDINHALSYSRLISDQFFLFLIFLIYSLMSHMIRDILQWSLSFH